MSNTNIENITSALESTRVSPSGVSFAGKSLKLDSEEDAKVIIEDIDKCSDLQYLNLEGNTLGVQASKGIAKALEKHPEFKRALWKDMFTGRMKTEIPKALEFLGNGLVTAGARLTVLDMSDNAFGPIGVEGLAALLQSCSCYALEELRLNNNGLGITGGKLLATALTDCYNSSKKNGSPLALKVFIAGRNRLENEGAKALAKVFKMIGTLEEIAMPQNGIYHEGISALSEAFTYNKNLQILNLNDNTIGEKGHNEIHIKGGIQLIKAMQNKNKLKMLNLNGNQFGEEGRTLVQNEMKEIGKLDTLGSLSEDESEDSEDESSDESSHTESDMDEEIIGTISVEEFLNSTSADNFVALGDSRDELILQETKKNGDICIDTFIPILMKVSSLSVGSKENISKLALDCSEKLYKELFTWSEYAKNSAIINNTLLVNLGLIKSEDKKFKPTWNLEGCLNALKNVINKTFVSETAKVTLELFLHKQKNGGR
ncbi:ran GTPase-activating protein 1 [Asbolus verrucosus]|uniref:Ran GTPase-activating protein 1 n=1 Tax=Asbolus verrucosus TaxID=1661398 RepID=A0A482VR20_ASBVE|nr:ran GTPase-activating protein 1 [Asbolus verrucosus]